MRAWLALAVTVAGCWTATAAPPEPPVARPEPSAPARGGRARAITACATAIDRAVELSHDDLERIAAIKDNLQAIRDAAVESCQAQGWSSESLACFGRAADSAELQGCQSQLTPEQNEDLTRRMVDAMSAGMTP
jgi:hypothetical protein